MRSYRSSQVSQNNKSRNQSLFIPPKESFIDKDTVYIKPDTSYTKNEDLVAAPVIVETPSRSRQTSPQPRRTIPRWAQVLIGIVVISVLVGGGYYYFKKRAELNKIQAIEPKLNTQSIQKISCKQGQFLKEGKCISCPQGTVYDGSNCVVKTESNERIESRIASEGVSKSGQGNVLGGSQFFRPSDLRDYIHKLRVDPFNSGFFSNQRPSHGMWNEYDYDY